MKGVHLNDRENCCPTHCIKIKLSPMWEGFDSLYNCDKQPLCSVWRQLVTRHYFLSLNFINVKWKYIHQFQTFLKCHYQKLQLWPYGKSRINLLMSMAKGSLNCHQSVSILMDKVTNLSTHIPVLILNFLERFIQD